MSDINWDDAPEGAQYSYRGDWFKPVRGRLFIWKKKNGYAFNNNEHHWVKSENATLEIIERLKTKPSEASKPVTSPIYTKAMADNGDIPSVGMECLIKMIGVYLPVTITYNSDHVIAFTYETDNGVIETCKQKELNDIDIKPITPPIELIDGECYLFESTTHGGGLGYYDIEHKEFTNISMGISVNHCTNIKLLEVKT